MTTPDKELREAHAQWFEQIAEHVVEAGEVAPYNVNEILEVLSQRGVPTPHQLFRALSNTEFTAPTYLRAAAQWIRDHKPIFVPERERNEMQARAETAAVARAMPEKLQAILARVEKYNGHGLNASEVMTLAATARAAFHPRIIEQLRTLVINATAEGRGRLDSEDWEEDDTRKNLDLLNTILTSPTTPSGSGGA